MERLGSQPDDLNAYCFRADGSVGKLSGFQFSKADLTKTEKQWELHNHFMSHLPNPHNVEEAREMAARFKEIEKDFWTEGGGRQLLILGAFSTLSALYLVLKTIK